jgi:hypothetical protein
MKKNKTLFVLIMLVSLSLATLSFSIANVNAQSQASVIILDAIGGTTDPAAGTYTYNDGDTVTVTANTQSSFAFVYWVVDNGTEVTLNIDNPASIVVSAGFTYSIQPVFSPVQTSSLGDVPLTSATDGIVVVLAAVGGTTNPAPGYYTAVSLSQAKLTAVPESGWQFSHWIISGFPMQGAHGSYSFTATPTDNPYTIGHGEGNTYNYQPVFIPVGTTEPTPAPTATPFSIMGNFSIDTAIILVLVVIIVVMAVGFGLYARKMKKP